MLYDLYYVTRHGLLVSYRSHRVVLLEPPQNKPKHLMHIARNILQIFCIKYTNWFRVLYILISTRSPVPSKNISLQQVWHRNSMIDMLIIHYEIVLRRKPQDFSDDESTLILVMAWCHEPYIISYSWCTSFLGNNKRWQKLKVMTWLWPLWRNYVSHIRYVYIKCCLHI